MSTQSAAPASAPPSADGSARIYRGHTVEELIPQIQAELGADAIVVRRSKGLRGGIGGFFQRPFVEIEAKAGTPRIDRYDTQDGAPALPEPLQAVPAAAVSATGVAMPLATAATGFHSAAEEFQELIPESLGTKNGTPVQPPSSQPERLADTFGAALAAAAAEDALAYEPPRAESEPPRAEPHELAPPPEPIASDPLQVELDELDRHTNAPLPVRAGPPAATKALARTKAPRARARVESRLAEVGFSEDFALELIDAACAHVLPLSPRVGLARAVQSALAQRIPACAPLPTTSATVALLGPGGAGKTSCVAALLGAYRKDSTLRANCATIVAGDEREQPRLRLDPLLAAPVKISSAAAKRALREARGEGLLLLDLPALSPAEDASICATAELLDQIGPERRLLALPATFGVRAAVQLLAALAPLRADAVAITHADETDQLGVAVEAACKFGLAPEYLLDRGRTRGGLTRVDPRYLAERLLP